MLKYIKVYKIIVKNQRGRREAPPPSDRHFSIIQHNLLYFSIAYAKLCLNMFNYAKMTWNSMNSPSLDFLAALSEL